MKTRIQTISPAKDGRIIAVSDIHGYAHYLEELLRKIEYTTKDTLIIIGDMIEKGPRSLETVRLVMNLQKENANVYATMGNVEYQRLHLFFDDSKEGNRSFLQYLRDTKKRWKRGFFLDMLNELQVDFDILSEYDIAQVKERIMENYREEIEFLWKLPTILACGEYIFVHAGIPTDDLEMLETSEAFQFLKVNSFLNTDTAFKKCVVVGHWPVCLYSDEIDNMNPIFDYNKRIISIDGGCSLKNGAQLNALIIPHANAPLTEIVVESFDKYPVIVAKQSQAAGTRTVCVRYFDSEVELLEDMGDVVKLQHISSRKIFVAPKSYLYKSNCLHCDDYSDCQLEIRAGDEMRLIEQTSMGAIVKKDGVIGWYMHNNTEG